MPLGRLIEFIPGTKAEANEVNYNFNIVKSFVDGLEVNLTDVTNDIAQLETSKANTNGDYRVRFSVADPLNNYDAVNLQTLIKRIGNTINYIYGLNITKVGDNTIMVGTGSCYDSTLKVIMELPEEISKTNSTQGANTTYYVYLIAKEDESTDVLIVQNPINPPLPSEYLYYRRLGSYTTDEDNKIVTVTNEQSDSIISSSATAIRTLMTPDWTKAFSINSGWVADDDVFVWFNGSHDIGHTVVTFELDGESKSFNVCFDVGDGQSWGSAQFYIRRGTKITWNTSQGVTAIPLTDIGG